MKSTICTSRIRSRIGTRLKNINWKAMMSRKAECNYFNGF